MGKGIKAGGGGENLKPELQTQDNLITSILETIVGKASGSNATADAILKGYSAYVAGELVEGELELPDNTSFTNWIISSVRIPYNFYYGSAVSFRGEIHILGGVVTKTYHYKFSGGTWTSVSTLPVQLDSGDAVVLNDEIHVLMGTSHYKWDGSSWTSVSTLPYSFGVGCAVVLNNELHILGSYDNRTKHYKWNGVSWESVSTLPYDFYGGSAVVLNGEIHILGGEGGKTNHYKWDGESWVSVSTIPYEFYRGNAVVLNGNIHILGSEYSSITKEYDYLWDGSSWRYVAYLPYEFYKGSAVLYKNEIYILGTSQTSYQNYCSKLIIGGDV